jgi:hypothetical protein
MSSTRTPISFTINEKDKEEYNKVYGLKSNRRIFMDGVTYNILNMNRDIPNPMKRTRKEKNEL